MTTNISANPKLQFFTAQGKPLAGGKLYTYAAGGTTPLATYTDSTGGTANANPVILDSRGEASVWCGLLAYKFALTDSNGVPIWTVDGLNQADTVTLAAALAAALTAFSGSTGSSLVGHIAAGTGAVATTVQTKLRETVTPLDFGATGDGVADDTAEIRLAVATSAPIIDLMGKIYLVSTAIDFDQDNQTIRNGTLLFSGANTARLAHVTGNDVTFENVIFDGNDLQPSAALVWIPADVQRPIFNNCTFWNLTGRGWGTSALNGMYALLISPYGVENFSISGGLFQDLIKYNDGAGTAPVTPAFVGGGFVGGVGFLDQTLNPTATPQTTVTVGTITGCTFDNIQTIRAAGLSVGDQTELNDADAIRTYGDANTPNLFVNVFNCTFKNVSKRCFKFRAAGATASNIICYAADLPYPMTSPIDLGSNSRISGMTVQASTTKPVLNAITWSPGDVFNRQALIENLFVSHCTNGLNFFSNAGQDPITNLQLRQCMFNQCYGVGISQSTPQPLLAMSGIIFQDVEIYGGADTSAGVTILGPASSASSGVHFSNVKVQNGSVYIQGTDIIIDGLTVEISSSTFTGLSAGTPLIQIGTTGSGGFQKINNMFINAWNLAPTFSNATRQVIVAFIGDNGLYTNLQMVVPETLAVTYPHMSIWGREMNFDGIQYDGPGRINVGTENPVVKCSISNAVRLSSIGSACTQQFFYLSNAASGTVAFNNIIDFRPTTAISVEVNASLGNISAFNVVSNTSNTAVTSTGGVLITGNVTKFGTFTQAYTATNVTTDRTFDADTVGVAELADVVGTLIADLRAVGFVV